MTSPPLFDFKAGRVEFDAGTGEAKPLQGQGRVCFMKSSEDPDFLSVQWLPRASNSRSYPSEELLIVPGDVTFSKVPYCETGRVIEMCFDSSGEKHMFWLQEASEGDLHKFGAADEAILEKLAKLAAFQVMTHPEDVEEA